MAKPVLVLPRNKYGKNRRNWLAARALGIGGSDAAAVLGLSPWASPLSLWVDKTRFGAAAADRRTEAMRWGSVLENAIAREMAKEHGIILGACPGLLAHPERPWQFATIDRYALDRRGGRPVAVVEVKNQNAFRADDWAQDGPPPDHVVIQVQHQIDVTGLDLGYVAALVGGNSPRWWPVERDDSLIANLRWAEAEFWGRVEDGVPPDPIGHEADGPALAAIYPGDPGREIVLDSYLLDRIAARRALRAEVKQATEEIDLIGLEIKATMGNATEGLRPDGSLAVTWRPHDVTKLDEARLRAERPEVWAEFARTTQARPLLTKTPKTKGGGRGDTAA